MASLCCVMDNGQDDGQGNLEIHKMQREIETQSAKPHNKKKKLMGPNTT